MGFDGGNEFDFYTSPLLFMTQPTESIAKKAVEILINNLESDFSLVVQIEAEGKIIEHN